MAERIIATHPVSGIKYYVDTGEAVPQTAIHPTSGIEYYIATGKAVKKIELPSGAVYGGGGGVIPGTTGFEVATKAGQEAFKETIKAGEPASEAIKAAQKAGQEVMKVPEVTPGTSGFEVATKAGQEAAKAAIKAGQPATEVVQTAKEAAARAEADERAKQAEAVKISPAVKELAESEGMSEKAAAKTIGRFIASEGQASEFKALSKEKIKQLSEVGEKNFEETTIKLADGKYMDLDAWNKMPEKYQSIGLRQGYDDMDKAIEQDQKKFEAEHIIIDGQAMKIEDWNKLDPKYQSIAIHQNFNAMDKAIEADIKEYEATVAKQDKALKELETYKDKGDTYDVVKYLKDNPGKEQTLLDAGFKQTDVDSASEASKLNIFQTMWRGITPWKEETGETITAKGGAVMAAEILVPGVYAARHWEEMSAGEKAFTIAIDAACVVPFIAAPARGARLVGTAGRAARLTAAAKAVGREAIVQARAPVEAIIHPIGAAKTTIREIRNLAETIAHPKKIPEVIVTTSEGTVRLEASRLKTPSQAMAAADMLTERAAAGERIIVQVGDQTIELTRSPLMREAGGGLAHASPDIEMLWQKSGKVIAKKGLPAKEQGLFFASEPATEFAQASAFGKGVIPVPTKATETVVDVGRYRVNELVRIDKQPVRTLNFADAKNIPTDLGVKLQNYTRKEGGLLYGSMNEWTRVKKAARPNDVDLAFRSQGKAINDIMGIAKDTGYQVRKAEHSIEILNKGKWEKIADIADIAQHRSTLPSGLSGQTYTKIDGILTETMGEQYLRQSYGAVSKTAKAATRTQRVNKAAGEVKEMLKRAGATKRKPGVFIMGKESAAKTAPSEKLFHEQAEMERVLRVGSDIPQPKQKLFTRLGLTSERIEIWLEKPLSVRQIAKLKAEGLIEWARAPFREPIKIRETGKVTGLTGKQAKKLSTALKKAGNVDQAESLLRAERLARAARTAPPQLARFTGRVSAKAQRIELERLGLSATGRARPERVVAEKSRAVRAREIAERTRPLREKLGEESPERERPVREAAGRERGRTREVSTGRFVERGRIEREEVEREEVERERPAREAAGRELPRRERLELERPIGERIERERPEIERGEKRRLRGEELKREKLEREKLEREKLEREKLEKSEGKEAKGEWTKEEARSAVAWKDGFVVHAIKAPYRRGVDEATFHINHLPEGLEVMKSFRGKGSQQASAKVKGKFPSKLTVDVGMQDVILTRQRGNRISLSHRRDTRGTVSQTSIKRHSSLSKKRGRMYRTNVGGSVILSRRPLGGY